MRRHSSRAPEASTEEKALQRRSSRRSEAVTEDLVQSAGTRRIQAKGKLSLSRAEKVGVIATVLWGIVLFALEASTKEAFLWWSIPVVIGWGVNWVRKTPGAEQ